MGTLSPPTKPNPPRKGVRYLDTFHGFFCSQGNLGSKHGIIQLRPPHLEMWKSIRWSEKEIFATQKTRLADFWGRFCFFFVKCPLLAGGKKPIKMSATKGVLLRKVFFLSRALPSTTDTILVLWSVKVSEYIISQCSIGNELPVLIAKKLISINLTCHIRRYKESIYRSTHKNQE